MLLGLLATTVAGCCSNASNDMPPPEAAAVIMAPPPPPPPPTSAGIVVESVSVSRSHAVLAIKGYSRTKRLASNGEFLSSCTFTLGGYGWSVHYFPDGRAAEDAGWISLYLHLDRSHGIDAHAKFKLTLLDAAGGKPAVPAFVYDHDGGGASRIQRFMCNGVPWGSRRFISRRALEQSPPSSPYLRDDCFRIRCHVTVYGEVRSAAVAAPPPSDLHVQLGRLLAGGEGTDVTFEVAGETVAAHRCILAARSPVFMAQLFGPMKEKTMDCVRVEDMEARVFRALLHFVYTDSLPAEIEHDDDDDDEEEEDGDDDDKIALVQHLLVAADRYGLDRLKLLSEEKLCSCIDTTNVGTVLALAEQHGCSGLKNACFKFLMSGSNLKAAVATDGFQHLADRCPSILTELLAN